MQHVTRIMPRVVYIGGFGNGKSSAEAVASALEAYYPQVDTFTFSEAIANSDKVRRAVNRTDVITHSAGLLAIKSTNPNRIDAFSPPLPSSRIKLIGKSGLKTLRMHTPGQGIHSVRDIPAVCRYDFSSATELLVHPIGNLRQLGAIATYDAVEAAIDAQRSGIPVTLIYTMADEFYSLSARSEILAQANGVSVQHLPGVHDELVLRPAETLSRVGYRPV